MNTTATAPTSTASVRKRRVRGSTSSAYERETVDKHDILAHGGTR